MRLKKYETEYIFPPVLGLISIFNARFPFPWVRLSDLSCCQNHIEPSSGVNASVPHVARSHLTQMQYIIPTKSEFPPGLEEENIDKTNNCYKGGK